MFPRNNTEKSEPAIASSQSFARGASDEELSESQEKELLEKCDRLLKEFKERSKNEDDSMDILQKY